MKKLIKKLNSKKGESFVELLIAVLIVALGCFLVASLYSVSFDLNTSAQAKDKEFYDTIQKIETADKPDGTLNVTLGNVQADSEDITVQADRYGTDDEDLSLYKYDYTK